MHSTLEFKGRPHKKGHDMPSSIHAVWCFEHHTAEWVCLMLGTKGLCTYASAQEHKEYILVVDIFQSISWHWSNRLMIHILDGANWNRSNIPTEFWGWKHTAYMHYCIQTGILNKKFYLHVGKQRILEKLFLSTQDTAAWWTEVQLQSPPLTSCFIFREEAPGTPSSRCLDCHLSQQEWFREEKNLLPLSGIKLQTADAVLLKIFSEILHQKISAVPTKLVRDLALKHNSRAYLV